MTTQGERAPSSAESPAERPGYDVSERPDGTHRPRRVTARRVVGWITVVGVVAAGGWIVTRPTPGDYIPGLGPSSKEQSKTPPIVGDPPQRTLVDPEALDVEAYFPAQRIVESGSYKGKRSGVRRGDNCTEVLQDRTLELLREPGCKGYLAVSFTAQDRPVLSSVTLLRFTDAAAAARAVEALHAKSGSVAFILPDASAAPALPAGSARPAIEPRVELVGHYVTVASSRPAEMYPGGVAAPPAPTPVPTTAPGTAVPGAPSGTASAPPAGGPSVPPVSPLPVPSASTPGLDQLLDEATRAVSHSAGVPFVWM
ncbi:hypothetical protein SAMN05216371_6914 [Streptomyces sp. TLI_053]|uniref:hypothetical protein n=1 Tax=Streptomyces sp. TLI_053 TaxID=1855352 RepID=UPI00087D90BA|nr:hypothetical protein [Streptomyces sp. TLI_053]SDT81983.1 hypothetical protein SAMN05216371_6914 [Streptomyces sp. TLI_053]